MFLRSTTSLYVVVSYTETGLDESFYVYRLIKKLKTAAFDAVNIKKRTKNTPSYVL